MRAVQVVGYHQHLEYPLDDLDAGRVRGRAILVP